MGEAVPVEREIMRIMGTILAFQVIVLGMLLYILLPELWE